MTDCLIIGGGIIGMLTARELRRAGAEVVLLERGETGREASWAGGGILSPLHPWRAPEAVTSLAAWSQQHYAALVDDLREETGVDAEWTPSGLLILEDAEKSAVLAWAVDRKLDMQWLNAEEMRQCEPALTQSAGAALWMPGIAQVRNPRLLQALKQSLVGQGVKLEEHTEVHGLLVELGKVVGVQTSRGAYVANQVVVAGGAWSGKLLESLGWNPQVTPVRGQMLLYRAPPGLLSRILVQGELYIIPRRDGRVLVGSTVEHVGFDKSTTLAAKEKLHELACRLIPALAECEIEQQWSGLRPGSAHAAPLIGAHPHVKNLYINTGHFRNGIALAPASARLLADSVLGKPPILDPKPYLPV